ncbi:MAG TPA: peptidyl-prolyl cis-trans isomerase [Thermodesulfobacteriota bacterium]
MYKFLCYSNRIIGLSLILLIFTVHSGCKQKEEVPKETSSPQNEENSSSSESISSEKKLVATVNGRPIYEEDLRGRKLEYVIEDEILYEEGLKQGLESEYKEQIDRYKKNLIINAVKQQIQYSLPRDQKISDSEIEDFYKKYERRYTNLKALGISAPDKKTAEINHERATKGEDLEKIASEYSESGVLFSPNPIMLNVDKNDFFQELKVGAVSDIIEDKGQFLIYKVIEVKHLPLSQVKNSIRYSIYAKKQSQAVSDFAEKAKKERNMNVEIFQEEK